MTGAAESVGVTVASSGVVTTMSAGYATKLSYRDDLGGQLGDAELSEPPDSVEQKVARLCDWVCVVLVRQPHL